MHDVNGGALLFSSIEATRRFLLRRTMFDLADENSRQMMAERMVKEIDVACIALYNEGRRTHLGASLIGEACSRKLYSSFRWCWEEKFEGRMLRLFNQGHREEERFITYLEAIGFKVSERDPQTGKQYRFASCKGHFGGSNDAIAIAPEAYGLGDEILLCEFKTYNTKSFVKLKESKAVAMHSPKYYAQMCTYGFKKGHRYAVFMAANKNDNDIYIEIVKLNVAFGQSLEAKAEEIIFTKAPPPRISENPAEFACTYCFAREGCHFGKPVEKNCRSCQHSEPIDNAEWYCYFHKDKIPQDFISQGCENHQGIIFA